MPPYFGSTLTDLGNNIVARQNADTAATQGFQNFLTNLARNRTDNRFVDTRNRGIDVDLLLGMAANENDRMQAQANMQDVANRMILGKLRNAVEQKAAETAAQEVANRFLLGQRGADNDLSRIFADFNLGSREISEVAGPTARSRSAFDRSAARLNRRRAETEGTLTPALKAELDNRLKVAEQNAQAMASSAQGARERGEQDRRTLEMRDLLQKQNDDAYATQAADLLNQRLGNLRVGMIDDRDGIFTKRTTAEQTLTNELLDPLSKASRSLGVTEELASFVYYDPETGLFQPRLHQQIRPEALINPGSVRPVTPVQPNTGGMVLEYDPVTGELIPLNP